MATYTPNYNLGKPESTDEFQKFRQLFNDNMDEIDSSMGGGLSAGDGIDITSNTISVDTVFTEASTRTNINSGDTFSTILGKIKKWFTDLPSMFVSKSGDTMTGSLTLGDTSRGELYIKGNDPTYSTRFYNSSADGLTADRSISLPDKSGTLAVTSDIPDISTKVSKSGDIMTGDLKISNGHGIQLENGAMSTLLYQQYVPVAVANTIQMPNASGVLALRSDISNAYVDCPRTLSANLNNLPQQNKTVFTEVNPDSTNLPDAFWYHVMTIQGSDTGYATQIAIGMTTSKVWYRRKDGGTWQSWIRII